MILSTLHILLYQLGALRPICGHAARPVLVIHDSQSLYAILTFGVFTFPDGFIIYHFSLEKKRNGFSAK